MHWKNRNQKKDGRPSRPGRGTRGLDHLPPPKHQKTGARTGPELELQQIAQARAAVVAPEDEE